jgi:hypothetical protein
MADQDLFALLASTRLALEETPDGTEHDRLSAQLRELRTELRRVTHGGMTTMTDGQITRRIETLERHLRELANQRSRVSGCGEEVLRAMSHNRSIDAKGGRDDMNAELVKLMTERSDRSEPDTHDS